MIHISRLKVKKEEEKNENDEKRIMYESIILHSLRRGGGTRSDLILVLHKGFSQQYY